jgi:hypothetical protein
LERGATYRVRFVARALEMHHAVKAGEGCAIALIAVPVELLLREDIPTVLNGSVHSELPSQPPGARE